MMTHLSAKVGWSIVRRLAQESTALKKEMPFFT
jgi:hypothetical protein